MNKKTLGLLSQLPRAADLQELCNLAWRILGNPVFVSDMVQTTLAYTACVEIDNNAWQELIVHGKHNRNTPLQEREVGAARGNSIEEGRPVIVQDSFLPCPHIMRTLMSGNHPLGVLIVTAFQKPFGPGDIDIVELISSFAVQLIERHYRGYESQNTVENFFIQLLEGSRISREKIKTRLDTLSFRPAPFSYLLLISAGLEDDGQEHPPVPSLIPEFQRITNCHAFLYESALVCVYSSEEDITSWEAQAPALFELLCRENLIVCVSREIRGFDMLQEYYRQTRETRLVALWLQRHDRFYQYDDVASFLMLRAISPGDLGRYCHQKIQDLNKYDETHGTELCITLQVYLEQAKSLTRASELLFIHRNTVRYRIRKCIELLNSELEDGNEIFSYILSLRILEFRKKLLATEESDDKMIARTQ